MSDASAFARDAPGVDSAASEREDEYVHTYSGELTDGESVRILAVAPGVGDDAAAAFSRVAAEWGNASTHPNVVSVADRGDEPRPWIAVERVAGGRLDEAQSNLAPAEAAAVVDDAAEAVRNAALYNTAHGSLAPEHVWVVPDGDGVTGLVDDWGLRRATRAAADAFEPTVFTAPELLDDPTAASDRTDVYGLGGVAYYALTGRPLVDGGDIEAAVRAGEVAPPSRHDGALSEAVDDVLGQALSTDPADRYDSPYAFKGAFSRAYDPDPVDNDESVGGTAGAAGGAASGDGSAGGGSTGGSTANAGDGSTAGGSPGGNEESSGSSRRGVLAALGLGAVGLGGGWVAMGRLGDDEDGTSPGGAATTDAPGPGPDNPDGTGPAEATGTPGADLSFVAQNGLAVGDGRLYLVEDGQVRRIDVETGALEDGFEAPEGRPRGLAYGSGSLWFADGVGPDYDGELLELDPGTGEVRSSHGTSWDPRGLAFGEGSLWAVDITGNAVHEFTTDWEELGRFDVSGPTGTTTPRGLAYFDGSLWVGTIDGMLYEFDTDGRLLRETGDREPTYGGLATADGALLGPDPDGSLTVLRTLGSDDGGVSTATATANGEVVAAEDLIARWPFEDGYDDAVGDNDASVVQGDPSVDTYADRTAASFDGDVAMRVSRGGHGELSLLGSEDGPFAITMWAYFDSETGGSPFEGTGTASHSLIRNDTGYRIIGRQAQDSSGVDIRFSVAPYGDSDANGYGMPDGDNAVVSTEQWHHLAVVADSTNFVRIYVDGERVFSESSMDGYSEPNDDFWTDLTIGSWYGGNPEEWANLLDGKIADVRIYDTGLSGEQVAQVYANAE